MSSGKPHAMESQRRKRDEVSPTQVGYSKKLHVLSQLGSMESLDDDDLSDFDNNLTQTQTSVGSDGSIKDDNDSGLSQFQLPQEAPEWAHQMCDLFKNRITDIETILNMLKNQIVSNKKTCQSNTKQHNVVRSALLRTEKDIKIVKEQCSEAKKRIIKNECHSRRNNLRFENVRESRYETDQDCCRLIRGLLNHMGLNPNMPIARCHRTGPSHSSGKPRPIIVCFQYYWDREEVLANKSYLYGTNVYVSEDFAPEVDRNRKLLMPAVSAAKRSRAYRQGDVSLTKDTLIVKGRRYTVNNMDQIPSDINPIHRSQKSNANAIAFFGAQSPLSNHHPAPFTYKGQRYSCSEQFLMHLKAQTFEEEELSVKILATENPVEMKSLGRRIERSSKFDLSVWQDIAPSKMEAALLAKFEQNPRLKRALLDTKDKIILEANPSDAYWGVGMSLRDRNLLVEEAWIHTDNKMGLILQNVRDKLFKSV